MGVAAQLLYLYLMIKLILDFKTQEVAFRLKLAL